jgi:hypothetical protein
MQTALEKFITIIRLVHEEAPDMPITMRLEGPQQGDGWCYDLTIGRHPEDEFHAIDMQSIIPAIGGISCSGGRIEMNEPTARLVVDMLENLQQKVALPEALAKAMQAKKRSPEFSATPPTKRLGEWREWAAKVAPCVHSDGVSDADMRLFIGERIETLMGLVEEYRKALGR